ncbi:SRPBCC family protein [Micromonospora sp. KC213]|uniref:aromatase/cyclase n=1 Tax=Micromonospora sp. KC213 TaxID=2530378 RepID=UPI00104FC8F6|nr:SRPBCC family protein [Micromonospora sp. KC213]TDC42870.1 cyclase [Micromonospora sp. KC213]
MPASRRRDVEHQAKIQAPAALAYQLIANVTTWSWIFPTTVHAERLAGDDAADRVGVWTTTDGTINHWVALRRLDPRALRVSYRQETARPPVADMGGTWIFEPRGDRECLVRLQHDYQALDDDRDTLAWIEEVLDRLSTDELAAFQAGAELASARPQRLLTFTESVVTGGSTGDVYGFLRDMRKWVELVPDLVHVEVRHDVEDVQVVRTETLTGHGRHASEVVRVCRPGAIAYRHLVVPPLATVHTGEWRVTSGSDGTVATARHTVVFDEEGIPTVLGAGADLEEARRFAQRELGAGSVAVLNAARAHLG